MKDYLQTVTGPVAREDMGLTLPHEHLFNDLSSVVDAPCYPFSQQLVDKKVTAEIQWALKHDPYCCADNMDRKPIEDVIFEINNFISLGGRTIVDATGSESIGRDAQALREVALKTGLNIVASSGPYLEKFESQRIHKTVDELATTIDKELNQGIGDTDIRAGMIGEIGVSPTFTEAEHNSLRAASLAQINNPHVAMNIHMPGWLRRGDEVLDIVLGEMGVSPNKVSLAHSDPSGKDVAYQRKMLDKGVWLEFDMIGLDITFPKEGIAPGVQETADAVAHLIELGCPYQRSTPGDIITALQLISATEPLSSYPSSCPPAPPPCCIPRYHNSGSTFPPHNFRHTSHKTTFSPSPYNPEPSYPADANDGPLSLPGQARCIAAGFSQRQSSGHVQTTVVVRHCPAEVLTGIHRTHSTKRPGGCASLLLSP